MPIPNLFDQIAALEDGTGRLNVLEFIVQDICETCGKCVFAFLTTKPGSEEVVQTHDFHLWYI